MPRCQDSVWAREIWGRRDIWWILFMIIIWKLNLPQLIVYSMGFCCSLRLQLRLLVKYWERFHQTSLGLVFKYIGLVWARNFFSSLSSNQGEFYESIMADDKRNCEYNCNKTFGITFPDEYCQIQYSGYVFKSSWHLDFFSNPKKTCICDLSHQTGNISRIWGV
jgi:hypothetical protein